MVLSVVCAQGENWIFLKNLCYIFYQPKPQGWYFVFYPNNYLGSLCLIPYNLHVVWKKLAERKERKGERGEGRGKREGQLKLVTLNNAHENQFRGKREKEWLSRDTSREREGKKNKTFIFSDIDHFSKQKKSLYIIYILL